MVQSIWLNLKSYDVKHEENRKEIYNVIRKRFKSFIYLDEKLKNTTKIKFLDINQIKKIVNMIQLDIKDDPDNVGEEYSTDLEIITHFLDLEFNYGQIYEPEIYPIKFFRIGRNVWGSAGFVTERLRILKKMLKIIKKDLEKKGFKVELDLDDCELKED